jgi:hypothetical protein
VLGSGTLQQRWVVAYRFADVPQPRARQRLTLDYNASPRLQVGFEVNFEVDEIAPRLTYVLQPQAPGRPMVHFNTSSDRIGTPEGYQQASLTATQSLGTTGLGAYVSLTYSGFDREFVFPFGLSYQAAQNLSFIAMNDGRRSHLLATYSGRSYFIQAGWIWFRHPAVTVGWGF